MQKEAGLKGRGAAAMAFDQEATTHRFLLTDEGGSIEVSVKNPSDEANLAAIRAHLKQIATDFGRGDFSKPFQTHAENPPGVDRLKTHKDAISYTYDETPLGARVRIRTAQPDALAAVHEFLNYQIREHHTAGAP